MAKKFGGNQLKATLLGLSKTFGKAVVVHLLVDYRKKTLEPLSVADARVMFGTQDDPPEEGEPSNSKLKGKHLSENIGRYIS